ncbi:MAG: thiamine phosphate synthase [Alphaproteobacteria bacterium]|nr:thiamine phosphate synthase [Alphaproteobacteria bacterium]|tara:strand:+ start:10782 stop:11405 length:624 start_codon:yes stop_codon:yes gene_type:complete
MTLSDLANSLNSRHPAGHLYPPLLLLTDEKRLADPLPAAARLPHGSGVILRHYNDPNRAQLAKELSILCRRRGLRLLIAGDGPMAMRVAAHGVHFPEARIMEATSWRQRCPCWLITTAAHTWKSLVLAVRAGSDAALLGSVFPSESHPNGATIGSVRFTAWVTGVQRLQRGYPVYALGGVTAESGKRLSNSGAIGIAGISGITRARN